MDYLDYEGLKYYHSKVKDLINEIAQNVHKYEAGDDNIIVKNEQISANIISDDYIDGLGEKSYIINLNDQWQVSDLENFDPETFDGVYESFSNVKATSQDIAIMSIEISGYNKFELYIRISAYYDDYVIVSKLDQPIDKNNPVFNNGVYATLNGGDETFNELDEYSRVVFNDLDMKTHKIYIGFMNKTTKRYDRKGYLLIPKNQ